MPTPKSTQPAAAWLRAQCAEFLAQLPEAARFAGRLRVETGTRFEDWIDHIILPRSLANAGELQSLGFESEYNIFRQRGAAPALILSDGGPARMAIKVESVADFLAAQNVAASIDGAPLAVLRRAKIWGSPQAELWAIERHGFGGFGTPFYNDAALFARLRHAEILRLRRRDFATDEAGFAHLESLLDNAIADLGADLTCDVFCAAEREYWQRRNRAARLQKARQDALGLGWANHDHHAYRSSRRHFARLIALFEKLGCACRERYFADGSGVQILEQPRAGLVIHAEVDLAPGEAAADFAHAPLPPRKLGAAGLWCALHGEAILQAGLHHLAARFDFEAAPDQLAEIWPVDAARLQTLLAARQISKTRAAKLRREGAPGSQLEILERADGGVNPLI